jgi:hypothetical protein
MVTDHFPIAMIYVPGVLQQLQDHWNPCILPVGVDKKEIKWKTLFCTRRIFLNATGI